MKILFIFYFFKVNNCNKTGRIIFHSFYTDEQIAIFRMQDNQLFQEEQRARNSILRQENEFIIQLKKNRDLIQQEENLRKNILTEHNQLILQFTQKLSMLFEQDKKKLEEKKEREKIQLNYLSEFFKICESKKKSEEKKEREQIQLKYLSEFSKLYASKLELLNKHHNILVKDNFNFFKSLVELINNRFKTLQNFLTNFINDNKSNFLISFTQTLTEQNHEDLLVYHINNNKTQIRIHLKENKCEFIYYSASFKDKNRRVLKIIVYINFKIKELINYEENFIEQYNYMPDNAYNIHFYALNNGKQSLKRVKHFSPHNVLMCQYNYINEYNLNCYERIDYIYLSDGIREERTFECINNVLSYSQRCFYDAFNRLYMCEKFDSGILISATRINYLCCGCVDFLLYTGRNVLKLVRVMSYDSNYNFIKQENF